MKTGFCCRPGSFDSFSSIASLCCAALGLVLTGCCGPEVAFSDLDPKPTASLAGRSLTIRIGVDTNIPSSEVWVRVKARIKDGTVNLAGHAVYLREQPKSYTLHLPASLESQSVSVIWVNPDRSRVAIPVSK